MQSVSVGDHRCSAKSPFSQGNGPISRLPGGGNYPLLRAALVAPRRPCALLAARLRVATGSTATASISTTHPGARGREWQWSCWPDGSCGPKLPPEYPQSEDQDLQDSGKEKAKSHRRRVKR